MSGGAIAATTAANTAAASAAAEAERRRREQEEEEMTPYSQQDLAADWEFKILRSHYGVFGYPERLKEVLEEEAQAGWVLVEKFDDRRIRLKRPATAGDNDHRLTFDPYRTRLQERMPEQMKRRIVAIVGLTVGFAILFAVVGIVASLVFG